MYKWIALQMCDEIVGGVMNIDILVPVGEKGGVENVINMIVPYLQQQGMYVRVVQLVSSNVVWTSDGTPYYTLLEGLEGHTRAEFIEVYAAFIKKYGVPDCILATSWPMMCYIARRVVGELQLKNTIIISWLHNPLEMYVSSGFGGYDDLAYADAHFAISKRIQEGLQEHFSDQDVEYVYNPVDFDRCMCATQASHDALQKVHKLYFVGRIDEQKRLDIVIQALATEDAWELYAIGDDDSAYGTQMKQLAKFCGVDKRIHWLGWQSEPWKCVQDADAVVLASEFEGYPLAAIEAQANGLTVLATPVSGIEELITPGENGYLFPCGDVKALSKLLRGLADGTLAYTDPEKCKQKVLPFDKETAVKDFYHKLTSVYESVRKEKYGEKVESDSLSMNQEEKALFQAQTEGKKQHMRILFCEFGGLGEGAVVKALERMGHTVIEFMSHTDNYDYDETYLDVVVNQLQTCNCDMVLSFNFLPLVSKASKIFHKLYFSWVYDCPEMHLYSEAIFNENNRIFVFDRAQYERLLKVKSTHVYYLPLAGEPAVDPLSKEEYEKYRSEVCFIGSMYNEKKRQYQNMKELPEYLKGYVEGLAQAQLNVLGYNFLEDTLTDDMIEQLHKVLQWEWIDGYWKNDREMFADLYVGQYCSGLDRLKTLQALQMFFPVTIYTDSDTSGVKGIDNRGPADSVTMAPKIFEAAKINLNITSKTIQTGITQRIFDSLANGGFVITNYQAELYDLFTPGEDLVVYESLEDLVEKVQYYLEHEEERKQIAMHGYETVKQYHTYDVRLKQMLELGWE